MARRKVKNDEKSPWGQCLTRPVPNSRGRSGFWLVPENFCVFLPDQKAERRRPFGTGLVRHCPQGLFSLFFTFLRAIFSSPFRLSLAPTICPWVSEEAFEQLGLHYSGTQGVPDLLMSRLFIYCAWFDRCFQLKSEILKSNVYQGGCCNPFCTSLYIYFPNVVLYIIRFPISQREFKV